MNRGLALVQEGRTLADEGAVEDAYEKYVHGLQRLLKLDKKLPEVTSLQRKIARYIDEAEKLKAILEAKVASQDGEDREQNEELEGGHGRCRSGRGGDRSHDEHDGRAGRPRDGRRCEPTARLAPRRRAPRSRSGRPAGGSASASPERGSSPRKPRACLVARRDI